jgi:hypothetical protein
MDHGSTRRILPALCRTRPVFVFLPAYGEDCLAEMVGITW